jgi:PAS domain S-box-containing protein
MARTRQSRRTGVRKGPYSTEQRRSNARAPEAALLAKTTERFNGILASAMDAIISVDSRQRIVLFNAAAYAIFGLPAAAALGSSLGRFIPRRLRAAHSRHINGFGRTGVSARRMGALGAICGLRANGEEFPIEASISQVKVDGEPLFTVILRDITERQRSDAALRESEERYRGLLEVSPDAIYLCRDQRLVFVNAAALRLFGATRPQQLLGKSSLDLFDSDFRRLNEERIRQVLEHRKPLPLIEERIVRLDGETREVEVAACPYTDGGGVSIQVVLHDITERKRLDRGILAAVEQEQQRVGRDLHDSLCQLLTATKYKTGLLERKLARKLAVEPAEARAVERELNQAIKQAHDLARGLNPVKLVARGLMSALEELAASVESAFQIRCVCEFPKPVPVRDHAVANHLYRIAQEAILNAIKHGRARSVRVELKASRGRLALSILDDGVGFPRTLRGRTGMGLSNMRARAQMIGALLSIRCHAQVGTAVTCRLERKVS